jgi:hypothetical protein
MTHKLPDLEYSGLSRTYIVHVRTFSSCTYVRTTRLYKLYNITIYINEINEIHQFQGNIELGSLLIKSSIELVELAVDQLVDQLVDYVELFGSLGRIVSVEHFFVDETHMLLQRPRTPSSEDSIIRPSTRTSLVNPRCPRAAPFADNELRFQLNRNDVRGFFSDLRSSSPPQALLISENLFHNIKVYFENSCRNMDFDDHGNLLAPNGAKLDNTLCNDFDSYCFTATGEVSPFFTVTDSGRVVWGPSRQAREVRRSNGVLTHSSLIPIPGSKRPGPGCCDFLDRTQWLHSLYQI